MFLHCTNQASVLLSAIRPDAGNETREQRRRRRRRRVGKVLVPHSAARDRRWLGTCAMLASARYGQEVKARATAASHQRAWTCAHTEEEKVWNKKIPTLRSIFLMAGKNKTAKLIRATSPIKSESLCIIRRRFSLNMFSGN